MVLRDRRGVTPDDSVPAREASERWEEYSNTNARPSSNADARRWTEGGERVEYVCWFLGGFGERRGGGDGVWALDGEKSLGRRSGNLNIVDKCRWIGRGIGRCARERSRVRVESRRRDGDDDDDMPRARGGRRSRRGERIGIREKKYA